MRARYIIRLEDSRPKTNNPWDEMLNQIFTEEAIITSTIWDHLKGDWEKQEKLRSSRAISDLLEILADARRQKKWTMNPYLAMISYRHILRILGISEWDKWSMSAQGWIMRFKIFEIEPKPTPEEIRNRVDALSAIFS
jgi:hypothetical protein